MAESFEKFRRFDYRLNSNLVIQKETHGPSQNEPTGEPESLAGRLVYTMGDKVVKSAPPGAADKKRIARNVEAEARSVRSRGIRTFDVNAAKKFKKDVRHGKGILEADVTETRAYQPTTRETTMIHEQLLNEIVGILGDQPDDLLTAAVDEVVSACRDGDLKEPEKKGVCEEVLGSLNMEQFTKLYQYCQGLHDYSENDGTTERSQPVDSAAVGEVSGVAVVFDEEDEGETDNAGELADMRVEEDEEEEEGTLEDNQEMSAISLAARYTAGDDSEDEGVNRTDNQWQLNVRAIDSHWLQRELGSFFPEAEAAVEAEKQILAALQLADLQECENKLVYILKYDNFNFAKLLLNNRWKVYYCTLLKQAQGPEERNRLMQEMSQTPQGLEVLDELETVKLRINKEREFARNVRREAAVLAERSSGQPEAGQEDSEMVQPSEFPNDASSKLEARSGMDGGAARKIGDKDETINDEARGLKPSSAVMDLDAMSFQEGARLMANTVVKLGDQSQRLEKKEYDEVVIQPVKPLTDDKAEKGLKRLPITVLPEWAQPAFTSANIQKLNLVQSKVFPVAFKQSEKNMLICAPTGAGKTNIAVLAILALFQQHISPHTGVLNKRGFKVVYVSPMKALVAEQVNAFQKRFSSFGVRVEELTGDVNLTRQQIEDTQIIVTTPEKWDVITRKSGDRAYTQLVKLVIIDEIHLLHDSRGPVLESLVARTLRQIEVTQEPVRLIGLSATLPNYEDVAIFLRVSLKENEGLFVFGSHYRPVPLLQTYIGLKEKKATKRMTTINKVTYEKVLENAGKNQILIFVHSRKETVRTARMLRQAAMDNETLARFLQEDSASREILQTEAEVIKTQDLKDLLPFGFAVHHAGLPRIDRRLVEDLFADRHIQVLVSTATLAWGVNLPAHTVIIKGTQIYSPEKGRWIELSPLDVMQMMGRAGRPQYDTSGHGIIITNHSELQFYLSLNNQQLPVESQMLAMLPDLLNAEITLGTIASRKDAVDWLGYTFFFVRLLRNPVLYGLPEDVRDGDPTLEQVRTDVAHSALITLDKHQLIKYERRTGAIQPTPLGQVASHYYIRCPSVAIYNEHLRPTFTEIELLRLFSLSQEFRYIPVREEEKVELSRLLERVPIPVKGGTSSGSVDETSTKINVLLQTYISQLKLDGFALSSDMVYVQQSAGRIMRALFDISLKRGWASLANRALLFCKMISARMWSTMSPLRQFKGGLTEEVLRKLEKKDFPWERYFDLTAPELGELVRMPKLGKALHKFVHAIPKVDLSAYVQPLTRSTLLVEVSIIPDFRWDVKYHDAAGEMFWLIVEDGDGEKILHHEVVSLKQYQVNQENFELIVDFAVPITEPLPPSYFLRCISDKWLQSETVLPISFKNLILPEKNLPPTELLDLQPLPVMALKFPEAEALYTASGLRVFGPIETQVLTPLFNTNENILLCAPPCPSGLSICAEFAILRMIKHESVQRCVYIVPYEACAKARASEWRHRLGKMLNLKVTELTGEITVDLKLIADSQLIICTPERWDFISRRWRTRRILQQVRLFIVDELELLDSPVGSTLEICISRMRYISAQLPSPIRFVGLSAPLSNAHDVASWLGVESSGLFNFPNIRNDLKTFVQGFDIHPRPSRLLAMAQPTYQWIKRFCGTSYPTIIFCPDRKQCRIAAVNTLFQAAADDRPKMFLHVSDEAIASHTQSLTDKSLRQTLSYGVGYLHEGSSQETQSLVLRLFDTGAIQVLCATETMAWSLKSTAHLVVVQDTNKYNAKSKRWLNYPIVDLFRMMSRAGKAEGNDEGPSAAFVIMCPQSRRGFYSKFKGESLPVESSLDQSLADHLNAEVALKTIEAKQDAVDWMTWSLYYRRLIKNPNFYGLQGVSPLHLSEHLSELVENAVDTLVTAQCLEVNAENESSLSPLNLGLIAAFYYIRYSTIDLLNRSTSASIKRKALVEVLCAATEFSDVVAVRFGEEDVLEPLARELNIKLAGNTDINDPNVKALLLLNAHFNRTSLTTDLAVDQKNILEVAVRILHALVDVVSSNGWLTPALLTMEVCQMVVQSLQPSMSPLAQLPYFDSERIEKAKEFNIVDIFDLINAEDEQRDSLLGGLTPSEVEQVATACNRYPVVNIDFELPGAPKEEATEGIKNDPEELPSSSTVYVVKAGKPTTLVVNLERVADSEDLGPVVSPFYPKQKEEQWWLVIGRPEVNNLLAIKRTAVNRLQSKINLDFDVPKDPGLYKLVVNLMCDSYMGCDQEFELTIKAV